MDFIWFIIEAIIWIVDIVGFFWDIYAWFAGKDNRIERREARREGGDIPARDKWNRLVVGLSVMVALLTLLLVIWKSGR